MKYSIIIPAYNEEKGIREVIERCKRACGRNAEIIVVDDGSADRTSDIAKKTLVRVIRHEKNRGKAAALKTGFDAAKNDVLVTIDADCTYPPEEIPNLIRTMENEKSDVVVGSRFKNGIPKALPLHRGLANFFGALFTSVLLSRKVTDVTTGLRAFKRNVIKNTPIVAKGLDFEAEFTARAITKGYHYKEVPISFEEREGVSSLRFFRHIYMFTRAVLRGKFRN